MTARFRESLQIMLIMSKKSISCYDKQYVPVIAASSNKSGKPLYDYAEDVER